MHTIAIIGAGFSGAALAMQLCLQSRMALKVLLYNSGYPYIKGIAYSTVQPYHVLNVPAGKMSLYENDPSHFCMWIKNNFPSHNIENLHEAFLPRSVYGKYIEENFKAVLKNARHTEVEFINEEVTDIDVQANSCYIVSSGGKRKADKAVLAVGNFKPENPKAITADVCVKGFYFENPWNESATENISGSQPVLILGTGLTMVDTLLSLIHKGFKGKIIAASTHGYIPLPHRKYEPYEDITAGLKKPYSINRLFSIFRKHLKEARKRKLFGAAVVDALRPLTHEIWTDLNTAEKKRFLRHVRHPWGLARHRLPAEVYDLMQSLIESGQLQVLAGRILEAEIKNNLAQVKMKERRSQQPYIYSVQRIINCTGPQTDITKTGNTLLRNLISKKMIEPDELRLGIKASIQGQIISDGQTSPLLFTLGSPLKGVLWESTAVPELRMQAQNLASLILQNLALAVKVKG